MKMSGELENLACCILREMFYSWQTLLNTGLNFFPLPGSFNKLYFLIFPRDATARRTRCWKFPRGFRNAFKLPLGCAPCQNAFPFCAADTSRRIREILSRDAECGEYARKTDATHLCSVTAAAALDIAAEMSAVLKFCWLELCYASVNVSSGTAAWRVVVPRWTKSRFSKKSEKSSPDVLLSPSKYDP